MKTVYEWKSEFAESAQNYVLLKRQTGLKFETQERYLRHFDTFYYRNGFEGAVKDMWLTWPMNGYGFSGLISDTHDNVSLSSVSTGDGLK